MKEFANRIEQSSSYSDEILFDISDIDLLQELISKTWTEKLSSQYCNSKKTLINTISKIVKRRFKKNLLAADSKVFLKESF